MLRAASSVAYGNEMVHVIQSRIDAVGEEDAYAQLSENFNRFRDGATLLHGVCWVGDAGLEPARWVLTHHPEIINKQTATGLTALHFAAGAGAQELCTMLLDFGADRDIQDNLGRDANDHARMLSDEQTMYLLRNYKPVVSSAVFEPTTLHDSAAAAAIAGMLGATPAPVSSVPAPASPVPNPVSSVPEPASPVPHAALQEPPALQRTHRAYASDLSVLQQEEQNEVNSIFQMTRMPDADLAWAVGGARGETLAALHEGRGRGGGFGSV